MTRMKSAMTGKGFAIALCLITIVGYQFAKDMALRDNASDRIAERRAS